MHQSLKPTKTSILVLYYFKPKLSTSDLLMNRINM
uniref:Uncharacterized protein n=1 Tax=Arundo donax TaxID=35708 RepID=A0A0A9GGL3_ARUDO